MKIYPKFKPIYFFIIYLLFFCNINFGMGNVDPYRSSTGNYRITPADYVLKKNSNSKRGFLPNFKEEFPKYKIDMEANYRGVRLINNVIKKEPINGEQTISFDLGVLKDSPFIQVTIFDIDLSSKYSSSNKIIIYGDNKLIFSNNPDDVKSIIRTKTTNLNDTHFLIEENMYLKTELLNYVSDNTIYQVVKNKKVKLIIETDRGKLEAELTNKNIKNLREFYSGTFKTAKKLEK